MVRGKAPTFIPAHHLGSEMKGLKFEGAHAGADETDRQWRIDWSCATCGRSG